MSNPLAVKLVWVRGAVPRTFDAQNRRHRFDDQKLQHLLNLRLAQVDCTLNLPHLQSFVSSFQRVENAGHLPLGRECRLSEVFVDVIIFLARQQHAVSNWDGPPGSADLLVVGHHIAWRLVVNDECQVRLVVAHAQRCGRDQALDFIGEQRLFQFQLLLNRDVLVISMCFYVVLAQPLSNTVCVANRQRVDNAAPGQLRDLVCHPRKSVGRAWHVHVLQCQAFPNQRPALNLNSSTQLSSDVLFDTSVCSGCGGQYRNIDRKPCQHLTNAPVVWSEVMPPI